MLKLGAAPSDDQDLELCAAKGTADKWTPLEQIWVAEHAHAVRGLQPWPETAHMSGCSSRLARLPAPRGG